MQLIRWMHSNSYHSATNFLDAAGQSYDTNSVRLINKYVLAVIICVTLNGSSTYYHITTLIIFHFLLLFPILSQLWKTL